MTRFVLGIATALSLGGLAASGCQGNAGEGGLGGGGSAGAATGGMGGEATGTGGATGGLGGAPASAGGSAGAPTCEGSVGRVGGDDFCPVADIGVTGPTLYGGSYAGVTLLDIPMTCASAIVDTEEYVAYEDYRDLAVTFIDEGSLPLSLGSFDIEPELTGDVVRYAVASFGGRADACASLPRNKAVSGTVELAAMDDEGFSGSYELVLEDGATLSGAFSTSLCNDLPTTERDPQAESLTCLPRPE